MVSVTGAAGRIAYSLIPLLLSGQVFGLETRIQLRLLDIPQMVEKLEGYVMEIEDSAFPLLDSVIASADPAVAFLAADVVVLLGGTPRSPGMERREMIAINAEGIARQAQALQEHAKPQVKVLCVANPANTNTLVAIHSAPKIPAKNFSCLTRLDQERLRGMVSKRYGARAKNLVVWGNHSQTQVPYVLASTVEVSGEERRVAEMEDVDEFVPEVIRRVQKRGAEVLKALGVSSAMSAAVAISYHLRDWCGEGGSAEMFSMGLLSTGGSYGIPPGIVFSFPCIRNSTGEVEIVDGLPLTDEVRSMLDASAEELFAEKREAEEFVGRISISESRL